MKLKSLPLMRFSRALCVSVALTVIPVWACLVRTVLPEKKENKDENAEAGMGFMVLTAVMAIVLILVYNWTIGKEGSFQKAEVSGLAGFGHFRSGDGGDDRPGVGGAVLCKSDRRPG